MTKYRVTKTILLLLLVTAALLACYSLIMGGDFAIVLITVIAVLVMAGLLFGHERGWRWTAETLTLSITVLTILGGSPEYLRDNFSVSIFVPTVVAATLLSPAWAITTFVVTMLGMALNIGISTGSLTAETLGPTYMFENLVLSIVVVLGVAVASAVSRSAQRAAEENTQRAEQILARVEQQARDLTEANERANAQLEQQSRLLHLVATLETPAVRLADGVLFVPIVGHIDSRRAQDLMSRLLQEASAQRARLVIIDISGVTMMDTAVARALLDSAQALRLLGCDVTISGVSSSIALTLTQLGVGLDGVVTVRSPQEALVQRGLMTASATRSDDGRRLI